jgi:hypothetical protein
LEELGVNIGKRQEKHKIKSLKRITAFNLKQKKPDI